MASGRLCGLWPGSRADVERGPGAVARLPSGKLRQGVRVRREAAERFFEKQQGVGAEPGIVRHYLTGQGEEVVGRA